MERLLESDGDAVEVLSALAAESLLDEVSVRHIPPVTVARDVFRVWQINQRHAIVLLCLLAFPGDVQTKIALRAGVNVRTVKRVFAAYRQKLPWVDALAELRRAVK